MVPTGVITELSTVMAQISIGWSCEINQRESIDENTYKNSFSQFLL